MKRFYKKHLNSFFEVCTIIIKSTILMALLVLSSYIIIWIIDNIGHDGNKIDSLFNDALLIAERGGFLIFYIVLLFKEFLLYFKSKK